MTLRALLRERVRGSLDAVQFVADHVDEVAAIAEVVVARRADGGTLYTAGNGGSAAEALHLAEELIGRYRSDRAPIRAMCLNADPTALTCIANDYGFARIFARQCEALLTPEDTLVVFSTSGNSANLVEALTVARDRGAATVGFLGADGGACRGLCDHAIVVPGTDSAHIQEAHQVILHLVCETLE
ncbi:MAG: SIS domain-containing protein [Planctomycetes bacterium]|nr:SIS domain-containing protein [Planctomycetota bacterium]